MNDLIVQKYGGTSLADASRLFNVARRIVETHDRGHQVCAVVSARGDTTDQLLRMALEVSPNPPSRELDMLLSSGERISCSLLAMAIDRLGRQVVSFTGTQAGIFTDDVHGRARIVELRVDRVREALQQGKIALVAGFQGVSRSSDVTTLGRGGSDTSAVALAGALHAAVCEIYTDVDGVYTANPSIVAEAHRIAEIDYEVMAELAAAGAEVLAPRCVDLAARDHIPLHVRSSFSDIPGTWVRDTDDRSDEPAITGVAHAADESSLEVAEMRAHDARRFIAQAHAENLGLTDACVLECPEHGTAKMICCAHPDGMADLERRLADPAFRCGALQPETRDHVSRVGVVGRAITHDAVGIETTMTSVLAGLALRAPWTAQSGLRVSCIVPRHVAEQAVNELHVGFGLADRGRELCGSQ
jgi:aspartate kinase